MICRSNLALALLGLIAGRVWAADEPERRLENREIKYWVQISNDAVGTGGGVTSKTSEYDTYELTASTGMRGTDGKLPVKIKITRYQGSVPDSTFEQLDRRADFDTQAWDGKRRLPSTSFVAPAALFRHPFELVYDADAKLAAVTGLDAATADTGPLLRGCIEDISYFDGALPYHQRRVGAEFLKDRWEDLLIVDLPADFDYETEWDDTRRWPTGPVSAVLNETRTAVELDDGQFEITTEITIPRGEPLAVKDEDGDLKTDFVKNGTGEGKTVVGADGWVQSSDTTMHVYRSHSLLFAGQSSAIQMQFYEKVQVQVVRTENVK